jgi:hypothetical protein
MRAGDELRHSIYYDDNVGNDIYDNAHVYGYNDVYVHFYDDVYIHVFDIYGSGVCAHDDVYVHDYYSASASRSGSQDRY